MEAATNGNQAGVLGSYSLSDEVQAEKIPQQQVVSTLDDFF
jgi:hypothetical protein